MQYSNYQSYLTAVQSGQISVRNTVDSFLMRIDEQRHLNVFLEVYSDEARAKAEEVDEKIKKKQAGRLAGMVIGLKDVLAYRNHGLQASSKILNGFVSQFTATSVQRLIDEDCIIIGRQNCDEFAMGSSNENSAFGPTLNFADNTRVPGGSSGASAVAVQAGLCHASIGSDTGGSVRQPSGFCGVVGLKPTYSRISRWGLAAYGSSFDCIGPITHSVQDAALLLDVMAGPDTHDSTVLQFKESFAPISVTNKKYKIGYFEAALENEGLESETQKLTKEKIAELERLGHQVIPITSKYLDYLLPTYYILTMAEASSNLSRYDGIRYGHRSKEAKDLMAIYKKSRSEGFGKEVKKRIFLGTYILSADYYDAYYLKALKVRNLIKKETEALFKEVDFIVSPTTPSPAFKIGEKNTDPIQTYLADIFTVHANVAGIPAISIPQKTAGLPIGFQIMAASFQEKQLLDFVSSIT